MPLSLTPVTPGSRTLIAAPATQSSSVLCSESLSCSSTLPCGETGLGLGLPDPVPALTLTPVSPA